MVIYSNGFYLLNNYCKRLWSSPPKIDFEHFFSGGRELQLTIKNIKNKIYGYPDCSKKFGLHCKIQTRIAQLFTVYM